MPGPNNPPRQPPVALTKVEAMEVAAVFLDEMQKSIRICSIFYPILQRGDLSSIPPDVREALEAMGQSLVDPELQIAATRAAAQAIRDMILEERVIAARVEAGAGIGSTRR